MLDDADLEGWVGFSQETMKVALKIYIYLSKGPFPDASEEDEVEKVDIGIEVNDL